ncbi:hypothetical protein [Methylorubrum thiocyanatum]|uniref:hypothetical protein n=1 Tax=Methylorubrum thiocyanatum TaxID=47958 RepID=UPI00364AD6DA
MSTSPIVYKAPSELTPPERESVDAFLSKFDALERLIREIPAEHLGMNAANRQVKRFLLVHGVQSWLDNDPEGLNRALDEMPNFPSVWPSRGPDADGIKATFDSISNLEPLPPFPQDQLPVLARAFRSQALKLLQAADDIEVSIVEVSVGEGN